MSELRELRAGARVKPDQVSQGAIPSQLVEDLGGVAGRKWTGGASAISGPVTPTSDMAELTFSSLIVTAGQ